MSAAAIESAQLSLIQEILGVKDMSILSGTAEYLRNALHKVVPHVETVNVEVDESVPDLTHEELVEDLNAMCEQIKLVRAGKLKGRPVEELLNEL